MDQECNSEYDQFRAKTKCKVIYSEVKKTDKNYFSLKCRKGGILRHRNPTNR